MRKNSGAKMKDPMESEPKRREEGPHLGELREKRGLSQRMLSERAGISRGRLRRLEGPQFEQATYSELKRISEALGMELEEIFHGEDPLFAGICLGKAGQAAFQLDQRSLGYRIISFLPPRTDFFSGKLFVLGGREVPSNYAPHADKIFLQVLLGSLRIFIKGETHEIQVGDSFLFPGASYRIENPLSRDSVALLLTIPAFVA